MKNRFLTGPILILIGAAIMGYSWYAMFERDNHTHADEIEAHYNKALESNNASTVASELESMIQIIDTYDLPSKGSSNYKTLVVLRDNAKAFAQLPSDSKAYQAGVQTTHQLMSPWGAWWKFIPHYGLYFFFLLVGEVTIAAGLIWILQIFRRRKSTNDLYQTAY